VLESKLDIVNEVLKEDKEIKILKVVDEKGNFLSFAIKNKKGDDIKKEDILKAVKNAVEKLAKEGSIVHLITYILEELGVHKNQIDAVNKELGKIKGIVIESLDKKLNPEDADKIKLVIENVKLGIIKELLKELPIENAESIIRGNNEKLLEKVSRKEKVQNKK